MYGVFNTSQESMIEFVIGCMTKETKSIPIAAGRQRIRTQQYKLAVACRLVRKYYGKKGKDYGRPPVHFIFG